MNFTTIDYCNDAMKFNDKLNLLRIVNKYILDNFDRFFKSSFNQIVEEIYNNNMLYFDSIEHVEIVYRDFLDNYLGNDLLDDIEEKDETDYKLVFDDVLYDLNTIIEQSYNLVYNDEYDINDELHNNDCNLNIVKYQLSEKENGYDLADTLNVFL